MNDWELIQNYCQNTTLSVAAIAAILGERVAQAAPVTLATKITAGLGAATSAVASPSIQALLNTALRDLFRHKHTATDGIVQISSK